MARPQVSPSQLRGLALACALVPLACDAGDDQPADAEAFAASLSTWQQLRDEHDNSYRYGVDATIEEVFGEPTCVLTTTFTIVEGEIVAREISGEVLEFGSCPEPWLEEGEQVGQHTGTGVAEPQTLDALYELCEAEVIGTEYPFDEGMPDADEPFAVDEQGIMARCGWSYWDSTHHRVESSPFIVIDSFEWL